MPIQFFVICSTTSRSVYLSNFLVTAFSTKEKIKFEEKLQIHSEPYWRRAVSDGAIRTISIDGIYVVFQAFGELMILIGGVDEADEHVLGEVMECFKHVATNVLDGAFETSAIQSPDKFSKLCVGIDEIFSQGIVECLDPEIVIKQMKLKNL